MLAAVLALAVAIGTKLRSRILQRHDLEAHRRALARRWQADEAALRPPKSIAGRGHHGGIAIPQADETKHFKLIGTTGTGKSTAIRELLGGAIARGDRAVFADPTADISSTFTIANRGDIVLNPLEPHSAKWDLFAEIENSFDVEQLAEPLSQTATILQRLSGAAMRAPSWRLSCAAAASAARAIRVNCGVCSPLRPWLSCGPSSPARRLSPFSIRTTPACSAPYGQ